MRTPMARPVPPLEGMTTLDATKRRRLRRIGGILLAIGLLLFGLPFVAVPLAMMGAAAGWDVDAFRFLPLAFVFGFPAILLIAAGGFMLQFGTMKAVADITATETAGATQVAGHAMGRGLGAGLREAGIGSAPASGVQVRCRSCKGLDSEDARFCSHCGQPM